MRVVALAVALTTLSAACAPDPGQGAPKATVADAPALPPAKDVAPAAPLGDLTNLTVDATNSRIEALGAKITATHPIVFHEFTGKLGVGDGALKTLSFEVAMKSLEADDKRLTDHLKNEDFFDIAAHPTATFTSTSIQPGASEPGATHTVSGRLSIKGATRDVSFPATIEVKDGNVDARAAFVIDRKDFGVVYPGRPDDLIQDNVRLTITLHGAGAPSATPAATEPAAAEPAAAEH